METWFIIVISLCISALLKSLLNLTTTNNKVSENNKLPPGPYTIPIIGDFLWSANPYLNSNSSSANSMPSMDPSSPFT
ncbi:hypothetical protein CFP56_040913 [Quercus suber]|uniref:Uncharacterized protein n=1 Tax=Quercus suber TaxID=58331 RepID=A0AAW0IX06_QUESU